MHFAAVCSGTEPLEYLIQAGAKVHDIDAKGMSHVMSCHVSHVVMSW